jgi:hypothetical protein
MDADSQGILMPSVEFGSKGLVGDENVYVSSVGKFSAALLDDGKMRQGWLVTSSRAFRFYFLFCWGAG